MLISDFIWQGGRGVVYFRFILKWGGIIRHILTSLTKFEWIFRIGQVPTVFSEYDKFWLYFLYKMTFSYLSFYSNTYMKGTSQSAPDYSLLLKKLPSINKNADPPPSLVYFIMQNYPVTIEWDEAIQYNIFLGIYPRLWKKCK